MGNYCYVAVCSAALGALAPTVGGEGRGHIVAAARLQLVIYATRARTIPSQTSMPDTTIPGTTIPSTDTNTGNDVIARCTMHYALCTMLCTMYYVLCTMLCSK